MRQKEPGGATLATALVAVAWALGPLLPALLRGEIPGTRYTDLYPSVWGLGWFVDQQPGLPTWTTTLAAPEGMAFYYSSPLHGWAAVPFAWAGGTVAAYVATLVLARLATVLCAAGALRALGCGPWGAFAGATLYGCSPFFQGYALEGIVEGTDGWALPLWVWMIARGHRVRSVIAFALCLATSWYLGMVACFWAAGWGLARRGAWISLVGGLLAASPLLWSFLTFSAGSIPLDDAVRAAMGAVRGWRPPWWREDTVFAVSTWFGAAALLAIPGARLRPGWALGGCVCAALSLGIGPWYDLPVLEAVRFPYRWHAGTLWALAVLVGSSVRSPWLAVLPLVEILALAPIPPVLPGAPADVPRLYDAVSAEVLLEVPGPVARPPGVVNPSRPRARYLLYFQLHHGAASPWAPDFNGVAAASGPAWLETFASWDPVANPTGSPSTPDLAGARAAGVEQIMVHRSELGARADGFEAALEAGGWSRRGAEGSLTLWAP